MHDPKKVDAEFVHQQSTPARSHITNVSAEALTSTSVAV
jgi:hypothetical protein